MDSGEDPQKKAELSGAAAALDALTGEPPSDFEVAAGFTEASAATSAEAITAPEGMKSELDPGQAIAEAAAAMAAEGVTTASGAAQPAAETPAAREPHPTKVYRFYQPIKKLVGFTGDMLKAIQSPDQRSRNGAALFCASLLGLILVSGMIYHRVFLYEPPKQVSQADEFFDENPHGGTAQLTTVDLGLFQLEVRPDARMPSAAKRPAAAEIMIVAQCDTSEVCQFLKDARQKARDEITTVLVAMEREELMSRDGKARLKKQLADRLNAWLPRGGVENLFFTRLVIH